MYGIYVYIVRALGTWGIAGREEERMKEHVIVIAYCSIALVRNCPGKVLRGVRFLSLWFLCYRGAHK